MGKLQNAKIYLSKDTLSSDIPEINKKMSLKRGNYGIEKSISQKNFPEIINSNRRNIMNENINEYSYQRNKSVIDLFKNEDSEQYRKFIKENYEFYNKNIKPNSILLKQYNQIKSKINILNKKKPNLLYGIPTYIHFQSLKPIN